MLSQVEVQRILDETGEALLASLGGELEEFGAVDVVDLDGPWA